MDFWRALEVLNRRKWLIALSVLVTTILTFGAARLIGSRWVATVQFAANRTSNLMPSDPVTKEGEGLGVNPDAAQKFAEQQALQYTNIARSEPVLQPALKTLGHVDITPGFLESINFIPSGQHSFALQVKNPNQLRAEELANAIAVSFEKYLKRRALEDTSRPVETLRQDFLQKDKTLRAIDRQIEQYKRAHNISGGIASTTELTVTNTKDLESSLSHATSDMREAAAALSVATAELHRTPRYVTDFSHGPSSAVARLETQLDHANERLSSLTDKYTDQDPRVINLRRQIASWERLRDQEITRPARVIGRHETQAWVDLNRQVTELRQKVAGSAEKRAQYAQDLALTRSRVRTTTGTDTTLKGLLERQTVALNQRSDAQAKWSMAQTGQTVASRNQPLRIIQRVSTINPPVNETAGRTGKLMIVGAMSSLLLVVGLVIALDSIDRRIRTVEDAERMLPGRILTAIPQAIAPVTDASLPRVTELHPQSLHAEAYRFLGMHLLNAHRQCQSIMALSAKAEQNTVSTVTNLGITLAQAGHRVIIVDANVRNPRMHRIFDLPNDMGLTDILSAYDEEAVTLAMRPTTTKNLRVITSGRSVANPWELFRSQNLQLFAGFLREQADFILYDTPSTIAFTDALNLAPVVDAAVLCVRALEPVSGVEQQLVDMFEMENVVVLGTVLTDVPATALGSYSHYQTFYDRPAQLPALEPGAQRSIGGTPAVASWFDSAGDNNRE